MKVLKHPARVAYARSVKLSLLASSMLLINDAANATTTATAIAAQTNNINNAENIETIHVTGKINSLILQSEVDLRAASSPDLRTQLTQLPSISVNGNGRVSGVIQYRGLYSDRVKVSIDNTMIAGAGPNAMDSPLSHVIGGLSHDVTLFHGIAPVVAGPETIGGAIDISDPTPDLPLQDSFAFSGAASLGYFTNDGQSATGALQAANKKGYVSIKADSQKGDSFESGSGLLVPNTQYDRYGVKLKAGYVKGDHQVSFFASQRNTDNSGTPALAMDIIYVDSLVMGMDYQYKINNEWQLQAKLSGNNNEHDMNNYDLRSNTNPASFRLNTVDSEGRNAAIKLTQMRHNWENNLGLDVQTREHNSRITNPNADAFYINNFNNIKRDLVSLYAQTHKNVAHKLGELSWQLGARVSCVSANADEINTNMAMMNANVKALRDSFNDADRKRDFSLVDAVAKVSYGFSSSLKVQASLGLKQKAPSYSQLYTWFPLGVSGGLADGRNYVGNIDLNKESAAQIDLGLVLRGDKWQFAPSIFYTKINDYIMGVSSTNVPANMIAAMNNIQIPLVWQNQDAQLSGFDFTYNHELNSQLSFNASGQYVRAKQLEDISQNLYRIAPLSMNMGFSWSKNNLLVSANSRLVAAQNKVADLQNETPTPGYAVFDLWAKYSLGSGLEISLLAENLFNKEYTEHLSGINRVSNVDLAKGAKLPSAGRNYGLYVSYVF